VGISVNDCYEVVVPCWLDWSVLGVGVWVPVSVVEINFVNVIVEEVGVVASVGAEVVLDLVVVVLVGVAFWEGLDLTEVTELWGLVLGWRDVIDLSVEEGWVGHFVRVWLGRWVVDFGNGPLVLLAGWELWGMYFIGDVVVSLVVMVSVVVDGHRLLLGSWQWEWVPE